MFNCALAMEIRFSPDEEAFRAEARKWLATNMPRTTRPESADLRARRDWDMAWQRRMYDAGWAGISWPREFGGRGATLMEQLIWYEEYARAGAPDVTTGFVGLKHAGPTLIACGTDEQKAYHLPRILRGDVVWCQGFSEPNAGSDLAALQTRAEIDGDHLVVTGQKIWTSFGHIAEFQELLVRTDPAAARHAGITWVICSMDAPGIEIRPIKTLAGNSDFCEVFYDQVRIPLANVVGKLNDGWHVSMTTLANERGTSALSQYVRYDQIFNDLVKLARATRKNGRPALEDPLVRQELARHYVELQGFRYVCYRVFSIIINGGTPGPEGSLLKLLWSEPNQRMQETAMALEGTANQLTADSAGAIDNGRWQVSFLRSRANTIEAGTSEIQRNIVSERVLGLPRSR